MTLRRIYSAGRMVGHHGVAKKRRVGWEEMTGRMMCTKTEMARMICVRCAAQSDEKVGMDDVCQDTRVCAKKDPERWAKKDVSCIMQCHVESECGLVIL